MYVASKKICFNRNKQLNFIVNTIILFYRVIILIMCYQSSRNNIQHKLIGDQHFIFFKFGLLLKVEWFNIVLVLSIPTVLSSFNTDSLLNSSLRQSFTNFKAISRYSSLVHSYILSNPKVGVIAGDTTRMSLSGVWKSHGGISSGKCDKQYLDMFFAASKNLYFLMK